MKKLIIIGASGFGREILCWTLDCETVQHNWRMHGFLDENLKALDGFNCKYSIIDTPSNYLPTKEDVFICAIGDPRKKIDVCNLLLSRGANFINLIHPNTVTGRNNRMGKGCIFCPGAAITTNVTLGDFITLNVYSGIGHDSRIGNGVTLSAHCDVTGNTVLGEGVFLGSHATILPSVQVGDYAKIGAGSVVLKKVKAGTTVMGNPAKQIAGF